MPDLADRPVFGMGEVAAESRRSPRVGIAVAAVVIAAFVAGIWYVYDRGVRRGDLKALPVITADSGPIKSSPVDAGGLKVPHLDGEMPRSATLHAGRIEDILPPPERPLRERLTAEPAEAAKPPASKEVAKVDPPPVPAVEVAPRAAPSVPAAVAPPAAVAKETPPSPAPEKAAPPASAPPVATEKATPTPPVAAVAPAAGRAASAGAFRIQLASVGEKKAAENEWRRLSRANADVLGKLSPSVVKVDLPGKGTFHRLSAGPFSDRGAATEACETLHKRKVGCFVVAP